jgi:hypothetical protein
MAWIRTFGQGLCTLQLPARVHRPLPLVPPVLPAAIGPEAPVRNAPLSSPNPFDFSFTDLLRSYLLTKLMFDSRPLQSNPFFTGEPNPGSETFYAAPLNLQAAVLSFRRNSVDPGVPSTRVAGNVWLLNETLRGRIAEMVHGRTLPFTFRKIDKFVDGLATSIKSINQLEMSIPYSPTLTRRGRQGQNAVLCAAYQCIAHSPPSE